MKRVVVAEGGGRRESGVCGWRTRVRGGITGRGIVQGRSEDTRSSVATDVLHGGEAGANPECFSCTIGR